MGKFIILIIFIIAAVLFLQFVAPFFWMFLGLGIAYMGFKKARATKNWLFLLWIPMGLWVFYNAIPNLIQLGIFAGVVVLCVVLSRRFVTAHVDFRNFAPPGNHQVIQDDNVVEGDWREVE